MTHGELWTVDQTAAALGVPKNRIEVWIHRGMPTASRRPTLIWSHDAYDWQYGRTRPATRDNHGRFALPNHTVVSFSAGGPTMSTRRPNRSAAVPGVLHSPSSAARS